MCREKDGMGVVCETGFLKSAVTATYSGHRPVVFIFKTELENSVLVADVFSPFHIDSGSMAEISFASIFLA